MNNYSGNVDAIKPTVGTLPVVLIDGLRSPSLGRIIESVLMWQNGEIELQLVSGQDAPHRTGVYLCTDSRGNVRYGSLTATAADCFRFKESYANGGSTIWYDMDAMPSEFVEPDDLDLADLSNWMLIMPLVSGNYSDHSMFPEGYSPRVEEVSSSISPTPCDNRTPDQLNSIEKSGMNDPEHVEHSEGYYQFYRWAQNLRGENLRAFLLSLSAFFKRDVGTTELLQMPLSEWRQYATYLATSNVGPELLSLFTISHCRNIYVLARSSYYRRMDKQPLPQRDYDAMRLEVTNGRTC